MSEEADTNQTVERENDTSVNRRTVLKSMAAAGSSVSLASLGIARVQAAPSQRATDTTIEQALNDPHVQSLLTALNNPSVNAKRGATKKASIGNHTMMAIILPTEVGSIGYVELDDGTTAAQYYFKDAKNLEILPKKYRDLPRAKDAILTGRTSGVVLTRIATQRELQRMIQRLDGTPAEAIGYTSSETEGMYLKFETQDNELRTVQFTGLGSRVVYTAVPQKIGQATVTSLPKEGSHGVLEQPVIEPAGDGSPKVDCSTDWCWRCMMAGGGCSACVMSCGLVGPACIACMFFACKATGYACGACFDCNGYKR